VSPWLPPVRRCAHAATLAAAVLLVATMTLRARSEPPVSQAITSGPATGAAYLGSPACQECHEDQFATWKKSLHVQMTRPIAEARVAGDFSPGTRLTQNGRTYRMESRGGKYFITVAHGDRPAETFEIHYTLGARRFQGYLSRLPDGRIYVLPVFWRTDTAEWIDYAVIGPVPDGPHDYRQIWNVNCVNCHATNLAPNYSLEAATYATTWTEMGIGCEACHGPGSDHVRLMRQDAARGVTAAGVRPTDPEYGARLHIFSPRTAPKRQTFDACAYCHGNKNNRFLGFTPGERYEDYALPFLLSEPIPDNDPQGDYWPDGRPNRFNRPQALTLSGCFRKGDVTCTDCHRMHGSENDHSLKVPAARTDLLCTQCHQKLNAPGGSSVATAGPAMSAHTHHAADSPGSRCIECHMSDVNWRLLTRRRDHTFAPPVPEMTAAFGAPNPCTTCHDDRSPEWAASVMDRWYGDGARRRAVVAIANVMYAAGRGDVRAVPDLASIAAARDAGAVRQASAAEFIGRLAERHTVEGEAMSGIFGKLARASADSEPMVRATAAAALGALKDRRAVPTLVARLSDKVRVVRGNAAAALLQLGVVSLAGPADEVISNAQKEYASGLLTFTDSPQNHAVVARIEAARGRAARAEAELRAAIKLAPNDARYFLLLGAVLADQSRFEEAVTAWRTAQRLAPGDVAVERLIDQARAKMKGGER
jgi:predicted CXXCH cytochrome family protein